MKILIALYVIGFVSTAFLTMCAIRDLRIETSSHDKIEAALAVSMWPLVIIAAASEYISENTRYKSAISIADHISAFFSELLNVIDPIHIKINKKDQLKW